ncbi:MAG: protein arginine kinase [Clostridia bacterium]|nr:protein arginine kinase [Clostridia bacterium]
MWYTKLGPEGDIVLSTRIRLARNLKSIPFTSKMTNENRLLIENQCKSALSELKFINLSSMSQVERASLQELHLISPQLANSKSQGSILVNEDCSICVMLGEEDHIRIQAVSPGFNLSSAFENANKIDDLLENTVDFAFDAQFGYLTACPTNTGTGLRASVMVHLPALTHSGRINSIIHSLSKLGLCVRGIYGEGSEALGDIYQISNQITLGVSEKDTIKKLEQVIFELISKERKAGNELYENNRFELEDKIMRSKGILQNARIMTSDEAMKLISQVRWGINLGIITNISHEKLFNTFYNILPATLTKTYNLTSARERDLKRGEELRTLLTEDNQ